MPWYLPADLHYFKQKTTGNIIIMGRKTFEAIGKPLPDRINIVLTKERKLPGVVTAGNLEELLRLLNKKTAEWSDKELFVIGGSELFKMFLPFASTIYMTRIYHSFNGDRFFPAINDDEWEIVSHEKGLRNSSNDYEYEYIVYKKLPEPAQDNIAE